MNFNTWQVQMERAVFWATVAEALAAAIVLALMYWVTKAAIRNAIKESGLVNAIRNSGRAESPNTRPANLPEMRAD